MEIKLYNTLTGIKEKFLPINEMDVLMYNCGPTVYGEQHIGNLSMFVFTDILRRTLEYNDFKVKQVINITDFGHLSGENQGDADSGEDKMSKGLKREGMIPSLKNMRLLAEKYATIFFGDLERLNIDTKKIIFPYASNYIEDQIKLIEKLEEKGFSYQGNNGVYFDTKKFPEYGKLGNINISGLEEGVRVEKSEKKNLTDFVLWKKDKSLGWQSPWGLGFPGWHIECSAMIIKILGEQIDIHTGGIEHIGVHHNNEIAQSEAATGKKPFSRFWLHREHIKADGNKIAKSEGNAVYLHDFKIRGLHPLAFRYWLLTAHYKTPANFTWESVAASQTTMENLVISFPSLPEKTEDDEETMAKFEQAISDDLNTPLALVTLHEARSKNVILKMDKIFGLNIKKLSEEIYDVPDEIIDMKKDRDIARNSKNWEKSDSLREEIEKEGYVIEDKNDSTLVRRKLSSLV